MNRTSFKRSPVIYGHFFFVSNVESGIKHHKPKPNLKYDLLIQVWLYIF